VSGPDASSLAGLVAIVTGASPSINGGIAQSLAERGADIACFDRRGDLAEACAGDVRRHGVRSIAVTGDVASEADVRRGVDTTVERLGRVDIVVNGAAIETWQSALECSQEELRRHLDIIVCGAFLMSKYAAKAMIGAGHGGSIINLASTEAHQGRPGNLAYGVSKGAVLHLTRGLAMEFAPYGIRVNSLTPTGTDASEGESRAREWGVDWTPAAAPRRPDFSRGDVGVPLGRRPRPSDYGHAAAFLASPASSMITGTDLRVDGGVISRYWRWNPGSVDAPAAGTGADPGLAAGQGGTQ
jgi:NAD(P)-dependent dehydrogenase (short-subunit alcohol dehydrogenase family)